MFNEIKKYKNDHFVLMPKDNLQLACTAPTTKSGLFIVYALAEGKRKLVYIGHSGEEGEDGKLEMNKEGYGGIKDSIVNGIHFDGAAHTTWQEQMKVENIEALHVHWYLTYQGKFKDFPADVEKELLKFYKKLNGKLPRWNKAKQHAPALAAS